ncbi:FKBP-type peptidyl-prolyl cis-trans isomerase [Lachnobacterium bovis]|uniref:FKBP-type peptidyl-prolyl cis-trans isomerase n=1 Tax=Lachnobacterium bovis TaxID=140626 RepID=UPI0006843EC2|nr:FKBP-type peptidyl-prolyl cis-trans isomerase [Lachnobacterium bovis]
MKKKIILVLLASMLASQTTACSVNLTKSAESTQLRSGQYEIDANKQVKKLAKYKKIPVTIDNSKYQMPEGYVEQQFETVIKNQGLDKVEVKDHDVVRDNDIVKVDYTGYLNNKKFQGGEATDVLIDVAKNSDATSGTGYIEGFTNGLKGAKVGSTVSSKVTFPANYSQKTLAGKETTFKFKVKGIYNIINKDQVTDEMIKEKFGSTYGVNSVAELKKTISDQLESNIKQSKYQEKMNTVKDYVVKNSDIKIPKDYLNARVREYQEAFKKENCKGTTLEKFFKKNNTSLKDVKKQWVKFEKEQISFELAFTKIANKEKIKVKSDERSRYIQNLMSGSNGLFKKENDLYKYFGAGNVKEGKKYINMLLRAQVAADKVVSYAEVTEK